jgi:hypothetical protein
MDMATRVVRTITYRHLQYIAICELEVLGLQNNLTLPEAENIAHLIEGEESHCTGCSKVVQLLNLISLLRRSETCQVGGGLGAATRTQISACTDP